MLGAIESVSYSSRCLGSTPASQAQSSTSGWAKASIPIDIAGFRLPIEGREQDRGKLRQIAERLQALADLEEGWNSYGAARLKPEAMLSAIPLLEASVTAGAAIPHIGITQTGGIHMEWSLPSRELEIDIENEDQQSALFVDKAQDTEWEESETDPAMIAAFLSA